MRSHDNKKTDLKILQIDLLAAFRSKVDKPPFLKNLNSINKLEIPVNYFEFYTSVSSVYSSKIEGEDIDFDSYFKYKFQKVKYKADYTKKADDLYKAYEFIYKNKLNLNNIKKAHSIMSKHLLPKSQQGNFRTHPMFVINNEDKIEYVAAEPSIITSELKKLCKDIDLLLNIKLDPISVFYFASHIHLTFVRIHPFQDGNGRTARLIEKWFLKEKLGEKATSVQLERNYYNNLKSYYSNIKKLCIEYPELDYSKSLAFLLMTINSVSKTKL